MRIQVQDTHGIGHGRTEPLRLVCSRLLDGKQAGGQFPLGRIESAIDIDGGDMKFVRSQDNKLLQACFH